MNIKGHFETITRHKLLVMKYCFACGLYEQGLAHDLSKYSPTEFIPGCIYYQGDHSPNEAERAARGYSSAWLHHKGRNKHHLEYWIDYTTNKSGMGGMKMPLRYVCEMVCDRVAASQIYLGDKYTDASPWEYYERSKTHYLLHPETRALLELHEPPTCIIFPDDFSALGGYNAISEKGLSIPEDISVMGYDGIYLSRVVKPQLVTYQQNTAALGRTAAEKLIELIEHPRVTLPEQIRVSGRLLDGGSVRGL